MKKSQSADKTCKGKKAPSGKRNLSSGQMVLAVAAIILGVTAVLLCTLLLGG